jgi:hypothetical protein
MKIVGIEGMSEEQMQDELAHGAKLVYFEYCISVLVMTFKRSSDLTFIKRDENAFIKGLGYTLISLLFGWWGIPWGPIYTIGAVINNCKGGKNVTSHFMGGSTVAPGTPPGAATV